MKNVTYILAATFVLFQVQVSAQRKCGIENEIAALAARDPGWAQRFALQKASLQDIADRYKLQMKSQAAERTSTTISPIPVIFHIIVDTAQYIKLGSNTGILQRIDSQIVVLNRDYNRQNADSTGIPSGWKSLYASVGIHFGLAHTDPNGQSSPGYELLISNYKFTSGLYNNYTDAKNTPNGLPAWDITKYMNIWCIFFSDDSNLLGITCPKSFTVGTGAEPAGDEGICINFLALGSQTSTLSLSFPSGGDYAEGRTLTHEVGHFFEIWHTWGDDYGLCPWSPGGDDDGLEDTPPEGDAHYGNPVDTIHGGTINDNCQFNGGVNEQPIGIATLSYLNYTDDDAMHLFTTDQAAAMASMALVPPGTIIGATGSGTYGESYSLTQNPDLLKYPAGTGISNMSVFPNPTMGTLNITFDSTSDQLQQVTVINLVGQKVKNIQIPGPLKDFYSIDLSGLSKGIYFIRCNFASGSVTRKILLQ